MNQQKQLFTIQEISRKLKIPKPTLRFWEKELDGIIVPLRTRGGQRRYTLEHISILEKIKNLRRKGMSLAEVKEELGNNNRAKSDNSNADNIDFLVNRIAKVVRAEVSSFIQNGGVRQKPFEVDE